MSDENSFDLNSFFMPPPPVTIDRYAESTGLTPDTVRKQIERGYIPTVKQGKRRMVDCFKIARLSITVNPD